MVSGEKLRALVVDDDPAWQEIVAELLHEVGLVVDVAKSLDDATVLLRRTPHRIAVVDLALGRGEVTNHDGLQVLAAVQRQDPMCAAILLTGYATVELAVEVLTTYGALSCLEKATFDRGEFQALVAQALASPPKLDDSGIAGGVALPDSASRAELPAPKLLVVEDDAGWRSILAELLSDAGYQVRLCNSYGEALGCLRREAYAVAIVDLALNRPLLTVDQTRVPDGYRLLEEIRGQGTSAIVVSGMVDAEEIGRIYGAYDLFAYIEKQAFDRRAFLEAVAEAAASSDGAQLLEALTPRELEVLGLLVQGLTNKELAETLFISTNTVKRHLKAVYAKLDVHTRAAAVAQAVASGLVPDE